MKYQVLVLVAVVLTSSSLLFANPRLDEVQHIYGPNVDRLSQAASAERINRVYNAFVSHYQDALQSFDTKLNLVKLYETWMHGNTTWLTKITEQQVSPSKQQYKKLMYDIHEGNTAQVQFAEKTQQLGNIKSDLGNLKNSLSARDLCTEFIPGIILPELPRYVFDESIKLNHIPQPRMKNIGSFANSDNQGLNEGVAAGVGVTSSAGCMLGTFLGGPPGCVAGAAIGAAAGYLFGYAGQAIYVSLDNMWSQSEFESAKNRETARQKDEIKEAKTFAENHPINIALVLSRAMSFCFTMQNSQLRFTDEESERQAVLLAEKSAAAKLELSRYRQILKKYRRELKEAMTYENENSLKNRWVAEFAETKKYQDLLAAIGALRRPLYDCAYEASQTAEKRLNCWISASMETKLIYQENEQNLKSDVHLNQIFLDWLDELALNSGNDVPQ